MRTTIILTFIIASVTALFYSFKPIDLHKINPHGIRIAGGGGVLPYNSNSLFSGSGVCQSCHGRDFEGFASTDDNGNDVNVIDDWRASMMANAAKDPFWQAKVSHEVAINPQHQQITETICTKCHAPLGHFAAFHDGATSYSMEEMNDDPLAMDGVSCVACHQQKQDGLGSVFSGNLDYETDLIAYGPYTDPWAEPMINFSLYEPVYSEKVGDSEMCATCHTLITPTIDLEGEFTGGIFVEQATYHEWLNSKYDELDVQCQSCHMPNLGDDGIVLSIGYSFTPRSPFSLHTFAGANAFMLKLMRSNIEALGLTANTDQFADAIDAATEMLQSHTLELNLEAVSRDADTATFELEMLNLAGHKFPSGYPARRAFVQFVVTDDEGNNLFTSGDWDSDYALPDRDLPYEPHHDVIRSEDQVQIYELVFADAEGNLSTILERAASTLKDNRFVPQGFSPDHFTYDTIPIVGLALNDPNFNNNGEAGSGTDEMTFKIPMHGFEGTIHAFARVYYQTAPPEWMEEMFSTDTEQIHAFKDMYDAANQTPILISEDTAFFLSTGVEENEQSLPAAFIYNGGIQLSNLRNHQVQIYETSGRLVYDKNGLSDVSRIDCSSWSDVLIVVMSNQAGQNKVETLFNQR